MTASSSTLPSLDEPPDAARVPTPAGPDSPRHGVCVGDVIADRYRVEKAIGTGGNGAVYRAVHLDLDVAVAIKLLHLQTFPPAEARDHALRFAREARTTASIRHRNVLTVHDTGRLDDGSPYLVMELIEGEDLAQRLARAPLTIAAVVDLGRQLFAGLTAIEEAGVVHRDVKPANLMLHREADGQVLLTLVDFGISKSVSELRRLTATGVIMGTPHYMAPEQLRGEELDARSDLYAACAVLYEAITGAPPFDGASAPLVIGAILAGRLVPVCERRPDCPVPLALLVERGLERKREDRPAHALELVAALDRIACDAGLQTGALAWAETDLVGTEHAGAAGRRSGTMAHDATRERGSAAPHEAGAEPASAVVGSGALAAHPRRQSAIVALLAVTLTLVGVGAASVGFRAEPFGTTPPLAPAAASAAVGPPQPVVSIDALLDAGLAALAHGEVDAALEHYRAATALDPDRLEAVRGRGLAAARAALDDEAILAFERYLALAPDASDSERIRGRVEVMRARRRERDAARPRAR